MITMWRMLLMTSPLAALKRPRALFFSFCVLVNTPGAFAQEDTYQLDFLSEILVDGALNIDGDVLVGAEFKYFLPYRSSQNLYMAFGYRTDLDKEGSSLDIVNIDIGGQYYFDHFWGGRSYVEYALGATYIFEEYSIQLIDREVTASFDEFGYKTSLGFGVKFQDDFRTKLFVNRYSEDSTTAGLSVSYAF